MASKRFVFPGLFSSWLAVLFCCLLISSAAANPFLGGGAPAKQKKEAITATVAPQKQDEQEVTFLSKIMTKITVTQLELKQKMSGYIREYKEGGSKTPLLTLFFLAFLYGCIHAAGPGHGKGIAVAYTLGKGKSFGSGLLLGSLISVIHAGSAMGVVFILQWVFHKNIAINLDTVTRTSQLFSFGLLTVIGIVFLFTSIMEWLKKDSESHDNRAGKIFTNPFITALAIGAVPCPGVIMILLFCLSLGQMMLGIGLGIAVSIGMALTITLAVWLTIAGKKAAFLATAGWTAFFDVLEKLLHTISALLLTVFGALLFLSVY